MASGNIRPRKASIFGLRPKLGEMAFDFEKWLAGPEREETRFQHDPRYDALPESIKFMYSPEEYAWLSDEEKAHIVERECMPDPDEFGG